jgi:hypothetical protein
MFTEGESSLKPYITEIEGSREDTYKIALINNSNTNKLDETIGYFIRRKYVKGHDQRTSY